MDFLLETLTNWLKEMLVGGIMSNLSGMFDSVNQQVADISVQVGQTPQGWNGSIFSMIENLSTSVDLLSLGVILAIVMTVDLIQMIADKNNLHDVDTWMIFKWVFKSAAAILIVTNIKLLLKVHGVYKSLISVAEIHRAPNRRLFYGLGRPSSVRNVDRFKRNVLVCFHNYFSYEVLQSYSLLCKD